MLKNRFYHSITISSPIILLVFIFDLLFFSHPSTIADPITINTDLHKIAGILSANPPEGFNLKGKPHYYGTVENKLENGTIFDYINGAGENYIHHGYSSVSHIVFENNDGDRITLDIYDMVSNQNAADAFEDESICASDSIPIYPGDQLMAKAYSYPPDYMLYLVGERYLVHLSLDNDVFRNKVEALATYIIKIINEE
jgi:hypothetical protein